MQEGLKQDDSVKSSEQTQDVPAPQQRDGESRKAAETIVNQKWFRIYWVLFFALCILLIESLFKSGVALGTVLWFASAEVISISFAKYSTGNINRKALLLSIPIALINIGHLLFYSVTIQVITWPVALVLFALQLTYLSKPDHDGLFDLKNVNDVLRTVFANAFVYISYPFKGLARFTKETSRHTAVHVLIGLLISLPLAGILVSLFSVANESFAAIFSNLESVIFYNSRAIIVDLILGSIMCVFVSAAFVGANAREWAPKSPTKLFNEVNNATLGTVLLVVTMVVVLYVGMQFSYWFGNVPVNYTQMDEYSTLARTGFFQLVWASGFVLALIVTVTLTSAKRNDQLIPFIKATLLLLCACNLVVLYSAIEKMAIYIGRSGITSSRVLVLWFIAVIVVCIVGVAAKIIRFSFKAFRFSSVAVSALVCALGFCNMDYWVAKNHIYLAEHHMIQRVEKDLLSQLSYCATIPIAEYATRLESGESAFPTTKKQSHSEVLSILNNQLARHKRTVDRSVLENPVMAFNFSRLGAQNALQKFVQD